MTISEKLETTVSESCDVLVCGGGFAGISAALAAARLGKRVTLLEKQYLLGGLGTAGLVTIYLPLCDGMGRQVSFGIAEELLRLSVSMGAEAGYPANWLDGSDPARRTQKDPRFRVQYNPSLFAILAVMVETVSGRRAIRTEAVVDATGDACVAYQAGAPTQVNRQGNLLAAWYYYLGENGYHLNALGFSDVAPEGAEDQNDVPPLTNRRFSGLDYGELSEMVQASHTSILEDIVKRRGHDRSLIPTSIATIPQLRMTRRILGEATLDDSQVHQYFPDSIGMVSDWRKRGPVYEVPFSTLYSSAVKNLITAGRCTSVTDPMWDIMRVIPCCAVTGQAAGTAAALCADFSRTDIPALQSLLQKNGVVLHERDL